MININPEISIEQILPKVMHSLTFSRNEIAKRRQIQQAPIKSRIRRRPAPNNRIRKPILERLNQGSVSGIIMENIIEMKNRHVNRRIDAIIDSNSDYNDVEANLRCVAEFAFVYSYFKYILRGWRVLCNDIG
jgi:hypothetical protein